MTIRYAVHPSIGIARVGDSPSFYLAPMTTGGLPIECKADGTMLRGRDGEPRFVDGFKKDAQIRRQAARFTVYRHDDEAGTTEEVTLDDPDIASISWTVHLANKKACWYSFRERAGDMTVSRRNTYDQCKVPRRNAEVTDRKTLIVDPGPRTVSGRATHAELSSAGAPKGYAVRFPDQAIVGTSVTSLGDVRTDDAGRLIVVGGFGAAGGHGPLNGPALVPAVQEAVAPQASAAPVVAEPLEANLQPGPVRGGGGIVVEPPGWYDDVADGPIVCTVTFKDGRTAEVLRAWCITGPPKFAPELVNAVTLDDVMLDVAAKHFRLLPGNPDAASDSDALVVNFERDIAPIVARASDVMWVAGLPATAAVARPRFDLRDASPNNHRNRERYAALFRRDSTQFFDPTGVPLLPIQAGSNVVGDRKASFLTLTDTQLRMLRQWARGRFVITLPEPLLGVDPLDRASVGNCVGGPMDPGIEVTWSLLDPAIYDSPWCIKHRNPEDYLTAGLSPDRNEQDGGGCEPGDLTKRLATPWQLDFVQCGSVNVSLNDGRLGDVKNPPPYNVTWWPVQRPVKVTRSLHNDDGSPPGAVFDWFPAGSPAKVAPLWTRLGFIVNQNRVDGDEYPNFSEVERQQIGHREVLFDGSIDEVL